MVTRIQLPPPAAGSYPTAEEARHAAAAAGITLYQADPFRTTLLGEDGHEVLWMASGTTLLLKWGG